MNNVKDLLLFYNKKIFKEQTSNIKLRALTFINETLFKDILTSIERDEKTSPDSVAEPVSGAVSSTAKKEQEHAALASIAAKIEPTLKKPKREKSSPVPPVESFGSPRSVGVDAPLQTGSFAVRFTDLPNSIKKRVMKTQKLGIRGLKHKVIVFDEVDTAPKVREQDNPFGKKGSPQEHLFFELDKEPEREPYHVNRRGQVIQGKIKRTEKGVPIMKERPGFYKLYPDTEEGIIPSRHLGQEVKGMGVKVLSRMAVPQGLVGGLKVRSVVDLRKTPDFKFPNTELSVLTKAFAQKMKNQTGEDFSFGSPEREFIYGVHLHNLTSITTPKSVERYNELQYKHHVDPSPLGDQIKTPINQIKKVAIKSEAQLRKEGRTRNFRQGLNKGLINLTVGFVSGGRSPQETKLSSREVASADEVRWLQVINDLNKREDAAQVKADILRAQKSTAGVKSGRFSGFSYNRPWGHH